MILLSKSFPSKRIKIFRFSKKNYVGDIENMSDRNRVKFYSVSDLSRGIYLDRIETILDSSIDLNNINDVIELFNIQKFIDNEIFSSDWSPTKIHSYQQKVSRFNSIIPTWIVNHESDLIEATSNLFPEYKADFWEVVGNYNIYMDWSDSYFQALSSEFSLYHILPNKTIVRRFDSSLVERLKIDEDALEFILRYHVFLRPVSPKIFLPLSLEIYTIEKIMNRYLEKENLSIRILEGINAFPKINGQQISWKIKKLAKQEYDRIHEKFFRENDSQIVGYSLGVTFSPEIEEDTGYVIKYEEKKLLISYSSNWVIKNADYPTLLNNFIYLFDFVDPKQMRFLLHNNKQKHSFIDFISDSGIKGGFNPNFSFLQDFNMRRLQMTCYYHFLKDVIGITIEDLVEYFFAEYLPQEFSIEGFRICMPTKETTYLEKCKIIAPELEIIMKSYHHYVNEGSKSLNSLEFDSDTVAIKLLSSYLPNKYVYPGAEQFNQAAYYLCSNQCMLNHLQNKETSHDNFIQLLLNEVVFLEDYPMYIRDIEWLSENGFIHIAEDRKIILEKSSFIIYDLFMHGYMSWWHVDKNTKRILSDLKVKGFVRVPEDRRLFSEQECDLYNYILNDVGFSDNLGIRNKYAHGNIDRSTPNSQEHQDNYMLFLLLLINLIIKINDELCIVSSGLIVGRDE